jgi:hypothetical protein
MEGRAEGWDRIERKPGWVGVYAGQRLSFARSGQTFEERSQGQNRIRENRPSGIAEGACGNVGYGRQAEAHRETCGIATEP